MTTTTMTKMAWNIKCLTLNYFNIVIAFPMVFVIYLARGVCNIGCQRYSHRFVSNITNQSCILAWHFVRMSEFYLSSHVTALQSRASGSPSIASILDDFNVNTRNTQAHCAQDWISEYIKQR
jgi:nitrogen fixation/metabolism regulation signal transduction histidine kinase